MKTLILLTLIHVFVFTNVVFNQSSDLQWLISNEKGKTGMQNGRNLFTGTVDPVFSLNGIALPNRSRSANAKNDLFVIYKDGTHFSSRMIPYNDASFLFNAGSFSSVQSHNFECTPPNVISYMYLTNIYEEDDYPQGVTVGRNSTTGNPTPYQINITTPTEYLSANHEVVFTKDITIIINLGQIKKDFQPGDTFDLRLRYDDIETVSTTPLSIPRQDIFDVSPVFQSGSSYTFGFPDGAVGGENGEEVIINNGQEAFRYINLHPTDYALRYAPLDNNNYNAVFKLTLNGTVIDELREAIRHSHDPNFLRVDSIARIPEGGYYVFYHLEFENNGDLPTNQLQAQVSFPSVFDLRDIEALKWFSAGPIRSGGVDVAENTVTFDFVGEKPLYKCDTIKDSDQTIDSDDKRCKGYVEFKVRVKPGYDVTDVNNSLMLDKVLVSFDRVWFPLHEFYDLIRTEQASSLAANLYRPLVDGGKDCVLSWFWIFIIGLGIVLLLLFIFRKRIF